MSQCEVEVTISEEHLKELAEAHGYTFVKNSVGER